MKVVVCVKRVPMVGGTIVLTPDGRAVDTSMSGFTVSPHEECAVEEAVRIVERSAGGATGAAGGVTVLTLGPPEAADQLRDMLALGAARAVLLQTDGAEWGPVATAAAIAEAVRDGGYDLLLFGNEAADTGGYQVPVRVAHALGLPCVTGIKRIEVMPDADAGAGQIVASREYRGVAERFELPLPAVVSVKEGINLPRYPSLPGRLRAKRAAIETLRPGRLAEGLRMERLMVPRGSGKQAQVLGTGAEAVPALVRLLGQLGVLGSAEHGGSR
jgi:electron transfer flavoprotein beta subunit